MGRNIVGIEDYDPNELDSYLRFIRDWAMVGISAVVDRLTTGDEFDGEAEKAKIEGCFEALNDLL